MNYAIYVLLGTTLLLLPGCRKKKEDDGVISQRYIHKYGYAVSKEEWETKNYPGQVVTHLSNGVTITATYENGYLHGLSTHTFPHTQTIEAHYLYNIGSLVKETHYDRMGVPLYEKTQLSPTRYTLTNWYSEGTPRSIEEYTGEELLEGEYLNLLNETESRVEKGQGLRVQRTREGILESKDQIEHGYIFKKTTFFPQGAPQTVATYKLNQLHGEKKVFAETGEPLAIEEWVDGRLHGKATYFKNGNKYLELFYLHGKKNGVETHYIDGKDISQQISWENDRRHGPTTHYIEGQTPHVQYFYNDKPVSFQAYQDHLKRDEMISQISHDYRLYERVR
jgi:antitoxin component YwqK of YwqJK toxin-antitoxin module